MDDSSLRRRKRHVNGDTNTTTTNTSSTTRSLNGDMSQTSFRMALLEEASLGSFPAYMAGDDYEAYEQPSSHDEDIEEQEDDYHDDEDLEDVHLDAYEAIMTGGVEGGTTKKGKVMKDLSDTSHPQEEEDEEDQLSSSEHSEGASTVDKAEEDEKKVRMSLLFAILSACGMIAIGSQMGKLMNCIFKRSGGNGEDDAAGMAGDLAGDMVDNVQQG